MYIVCTVRILCFWVVYSCVDDCCENGMHVHVTTFVLCVYAVTALCCSKTVYMEYMYLFPHISVYSVLFDAYTEGGNLIPYASSINASTGSRSSLTRHVWSDHSLSVMDIHCGSGGLRCRVATASLDQTCKVRKTCLYDLTIIL